MLPILSNTVVNSPVISLALVNILLQVPRSLQIIKKLGQNLA